MNFKKPTKVIRTNIQGWYSMNLILNYSPHTFTKNHHKFLNNLLKFIYSEKATKFCENFTLLLTDCTVDKSKVKILQNFVALSEYVNFNQWIFLWPCTHYIVCVQNILSVFKINWMHTLFCTSKHIVHQKTLGLHLWIYLTLSPRQRSYLIW